MLPELKKFLQDILRIQIKLSATSIRLVQLQLGLLTCFYVNKKGCLITSPTLQAMFFGNIFGNVKLFLRLKCFNGKYSTTFFPLKRSCFIKKWYNLTFAGCVIQHLKLLSTCSLNATMPEQPSLLLLSLIYLISLNFLLCMNGGKMLIFYFMLIQNCLL